MTGIAYGAGLFSETIRLGGPVLLEVDGVALILYGRVRPAEISPLRTSADIRRASVEGLRR